MKNIEKLRNQIDKIDNQILNLLKNRSKLSLEIGILKKGKPGSENLFRPERQVKILSRLFLKKNNLIKEDDIFTFWRDIFFHQTRLQGKLTFLTSKFLTKKEKKTFYNSFGYNSDLLICKDLKKAFSLVKKNKNTLLILPFPGKGKKNDWWIEKKFKDIFIVASLPFTASPSTNTKLLVLSKYKPILKGNCSYIYISTREVNNKNLKKIISLRGSDLFISNTLFKNRDLKMIGAIPHIDNIYEN